MWQSGSLIHLSFNTEWQGNTLTPSVCSELIRSARKDEMHQMSKAKVLRSKDPSVFSYGTDFLHLSRSESPDRYLSALQQSVYAFSRMEKPMVSLVEGLASGSAVSLVYLSPFAACTAKSRFYFPETSYGFVPTGGTSYFLSRMTGNLGMYLALTGTSLNGEDSVIMNFAYKLIDNPDDFLYNLEGYASAVDNRPTKTLYGDQWAAHVEKEFQEKLDFERENKNLIDNRAGIRNYKNPNRENIHMVYADVLYRQKMHEHNNQENSFRKFKGQKITNNLEFFQEAVMDHIDGPETMDFSLDLWVPAINRVFSAPSIEEIWERLEKEQEYPAYKDWAVRTKESLMKKSPLALELTFKMLRSAKDLQWHECLGLEYSVGSKLAFNVDFREAVQAKLSKNKSRYEWKPASISPEQVQEYFEGNHTPLNLDSLEYELLPVKDWYSMYPQGPRMWLNQQNPLLQIQREDFEFDVKIFMNSLNVNVMNPGLDLVKLREALYKQEMYATSVREKNSQVELLDRFSQDIYVRQRRESIELLFKDKEAMKSLIEVLIEKRFEDKFNEKVETVREKSYMAQFREKQKFFKELKDFMHHNEFRESQLDHKKIYEQLNQPRMLDTSFGFAKDNKQSFIDTKTSTSPGALSVVYKDELHSIEDYRSFYMNSKNSFIDETVLEEYIESINKLADGISKVIEHTKEHEDSTVLGILKEEIYVKTGDKNFRNGLNLMKRGSFSPNRSEISQRRLQLIREKLTVEDNKDPNPRKQKLKTLFSEFLLKPSIDEIDKSVLDILELENTSQVLSEIYKLLHIRHNPVQYPGKLIYDTRMKAEKVEEEIDFNQGYPEGSYILNDLTSRADLDVLYDRAVYKEKSYIPASLELSEEQKQIMDFKLADFSESPVKWVIRNLEDAINSLFDERIKIEDQLTDAGLMEYDQKLAPKLESTYLKKMVLKKLELEVALLNWEDKKEQPPKAVADGKITGFWDKHLEHGILYDASVYYNQYRGISELGKPKTPAYATPEEETMYKQTILESLDKDVSPFPHEDMYWELWKPAKLRTAREREELEYELKEKLQLKKKELENSAKIAVALERIIDSEKWKARISDPEFIKEFLSKQ